MTGEWVRGSLSTFTLKPSIAVLMPLKDFSGHCRNVDHDSMQLFPGQCRDTSHGNLQFL